MSLDRFVSAQRDTYAGALAEIRNGRKTRHWMWFVFPQLEGLGRSPNARYYGISGLAEARAYLADPVLGPRLVEISRALLAHSEHTAAEILGDVDALKLRFCATLFDAAGGDDVFQQILDRFFQGGKCGATLEMLNRH